MQSAIEGVWEPHRLATVRLTLLGAFALRCAGREVLRLPRKARALLAYLALEETGPLTREAVAELLWPQRGSEQARHSLRQVLLTLGRTVGDHPLMISCERALRLAPAVTSDVKVLRGLPRDASASDLQAAADLYVGPLLQHFPSVSPDFDDWLQGMRLSVDAAMLNVLARLSDRALAAGDPEAVALIERMLAIDPLREDVHRRLMLAFAQSGRPAEALRHYASTRDLLRRELDVGPAAETEALARQIRGEISSVPVVRSAQPSSSAPPRIAVLPFLQLGSTSLPSYWADGLMADITSQLAGLRELSVISHGSTLQLRDSQADPCELGRRLGSRYVLRGTLRRAGSEVRLNTELVQTDQGTVLSSRLTDIPRDLTFEGQDRVVAQVVNTLAPRVHEAELQRIRGRRPDSLTAYEKVLLARELMFGLDSTNFRRAKALLDDSIAEEPDYAEPYALASNWYGLTVAEGWSTDRSADVANTERFAHKALSLDRENVRALVSYAHRRSLLRRDYRTAQSLFGRALDVQPSSADAWRYSSFTYAYVGDPAEAIRRAERAFQLSPCDRDAHGFYLALCVAYYTDGNYDQAVDWGLRALAEQRVLRGTGGWVAAALAALGRTAEAREVAADTMSRWPERRVRVVVEHHPYRDAVRREDYGRHLLAAGFPE